MKFVHAIVVCVLAVSVFGCVTSRETLRLQKELAASEERLQACRQSAERAASMLEEVDQRILSIQRRFLNGQPTTQVLCNNCVNPPDDRQCAKFCVITTRVLWDPKRPPPTEAMCAQLQKAPMTLANAQDLRTCGADAQTEIIVEMQERRQLEKKILEEETELLRRMWRHDHCNDCRSPPDTAECKTLCAKVGVEDR